MLEVDHGAEGLATVVERLCSFPGASDLPARRPPCPEPLPSRDRVAWIAEELRAVLFPGFFGPAETVGASLRYHLGAALDSAARELEEQVRRALCFACAGREPAADCAARASALAARFLQRLPDIQRMLFEDVAAAYEGDPACVSPDEAILAYPGVHALSYARVAHELYVLDVPLLPRMITEIAHGATGIDIHPGARIGRRFFIDHGTGVVIGATCVIGDRVRIYQGVTLGAKSFQLDEEGRPVKGVPRHPIIEDDVVIYAGATILGRITIGRESVIGGNVWLTRNVPPGSRVRQGSARYDTYHSGSGI